MNESWHTYEWVTSHIWMSHVTHVNESCHTYRVMSHIWMSHVTHINQSRHTYEWVMSNMWMSHTSHMNESRNASHIWIHHGRHIWTSHGTHINESRHTNEWVHSCATCLNYTEFIHVWRDSFTYIHFTMYVCSHMYKWVMSHIHHMYKWVMTHLHTYISQCVYVVTRINESCHTTSHV